MHKTFRRSTPLLLLGLLAACGGGGDDAGTPGPGPGPATTNGTFVDSAVIGLSYACGTGTNQTTGVTDAQGHFAYVDGTTKPSCTFKVGAVVVGTAAAGAMLTPYSLVAGSTPGTQNTTVENIARFLQSIDADNDPSNGITIQVGGNAALNAAGAGALDFSSAGFDAAAGGIVGAAIPGRTLVSATTAVNAMNGTLLAQYAGTYNCTYSGVVNGANTMLGNVSVTLTGAVLTGTGTPTYPAGVVHNPFTLTGTLTPAGIGNSSTSTGATFDGNFTTDGKGHGTWDDPDLGSGTWDCTHT
jgi:hypothetical protein